MSTAERIAAGLCDLGLRESADKADRLAAYLELIAKWNRVTNLTAVPDPGEAVALHLMDSLSVYPFVIGDRILDVGSGAGLPGIPLALLMPDKDFILLDSNGKKTRFMTQAAIELQLENVTVIQQRVEDCTEMFDQVISRAFASLEDFLRLCLPRLSPGGSLLAMKGPSEKEQVENLEQGSLHSLSVPGLDRERYLMVIPCEACP